MNFFAPTANSQLYIASDTGNDKGFAAFLLPDPPAVLPKEGYSIQQALTDTTLKGSFIYSVQRPDTSTAAATDDLVKRLTALLPRNSREMMWINDFKKLNTQGNEMTLGVEGNGATTNTGMSVPLITNILLQIPSGLALKASENAILLGFPDGTAKIRFSGSVAPDPNRSYAVTGVLPLSGPYRGCFNFGMYIARSSMGTGFKWGFQMLVPLLNNPNQQTKAEYLPFARETEPSMNDALGFEIKIDPTDVFNTSVDYTNVKDKNITDQYNSRRTVFNFTGKNRDEQETVLSSYFFTAWGDKIGLVPGKSGNSGLQGRLVFNLGEQYSANMQRSHLAPEGDFVILMDGAGADTLYPLQCGLQSTEFFNVQSRTATTTGDRIRFIANQPAYAPVYPLPPSSPVTAPVNPDAPLLDTTYRTSWCTIIKGTGTKPVSYVAQPKGAALFGKKDETLHNAITKDATIIEHVTPNFTYTANDTVLFPMMPYTAVVPDPSGQNSLSFAQIEDVEKIFLSPIRKKKINDILKASHQKAMAMFGNMEGDNTPPREEVNTLRATYSTPSGLIAELSPTQQNSDSNQIWNAINLAQNNTGPDTEFTKMYFANPDSELVQAFQTSDLFLVIANNKHTGAAVNADSAVGGLARFYNDMFIGQWTMQANTGTQNRYNNYNNIIIVKGRKGKLYDPKDIENSLVTNWQKWTDKDTFGAPSILDAKGEQTMAPDPSQLVILSQWMQTYFDDASKQADTAYFGNFNRIAVDPNWTGILILGMNIKGLPPNLNGILSGVRYPDTFRAHHFGINITPISRGENGPDLKSPSAMFGLIYYNDPDFIAQPDPQPIEPNLTETYDFALLNLKVLFENTSVKSFQSYAQLTTNSYFGSAADHMGQGGNSYNTMILKGALQFKGEEAIYSLATDGANTFYFNNPVVNKLEVTNAVFSTIGLNKEGKLVSWFSINGFWDFKSLVNTPDAEDSKAQSAATPFDIFSFGNDTGKDDPRKGLIFNGLGIQMVSPKYVPGQTTALPKTMTFETGALTFDQGRSTPRPNSLYTNFALNLQNLVQGNIDTMPEGKDYLTVITDLKVATIEGTPWLGLSYQLNMGTPGALAGNVGLTSTLLTAWDPTANVEEGIAPPVLVGIKLPGTGGGAKLISLQSVLKLSVGQIRLAVDNTNPDKPAFLLMLTEIALKFLGMLKIPPNGTSLFYLFGNPQTGGKPSGLGWYAMYNKEPKSKDKKESTFKAPLSTNP